MALIKQRCVGLQKRAVWSCMVLRRGCTGGARSCVMLHTGCMWLHDAAQGASMRMPQDAENVQDVVHLALPPPVPLTSAFRASEWPTPRRLARAGPAGQEAYHRTAVLPSFIRSCSSLTVDRPATHVHM
eukprot:358784-Chlamydomonas_euryale.AAC.3